MIETINPSGNLSGFVRTGSGHGDAPRIRVLTWRELMARFDGVRRLRPFCATAAQSGSFAPVAACRIALLEHGNLAVNRAGLGNLKADNGTDRAVAAVCNSTI